MCFLVVLKSIFDKMKDAILEKCGNLFDSKPPEKVEVFPNAGELGTVFDEPVTNITLPIIL